MATTIHTSGNKRRLPPCRAACPARVNVQGYISLLQQGRFKESVELIKKYIAFPAICGRVCFSPCEDACSRTNADQAVAIRALKRLVADIEREQGRVIPEPIPKTHREKIAVIGAGPAGLSAAYDLAKLGYPVTVYERMPEPGGMMRYGIPSFRLQKFVVANEIAYVKDLGVEVKTGVEFGKDITLYSLLNEGYKAIFIAIGAQLSRKLGISGEDLAGVIHAIEFLRDLSLGKHVDVGERVAVIGGGNSAIDAARTARRLGAKEVMILYRRSRNEMPALPLEIGAAEEEGIRLRFLVAPKRIIGESGKVKAVECLRMKLGEPDAGGRRRPLPIEHSEHMYKVDTIIPAIGQLPDTSCLPLILLDVGEERARKKISAIPAHAVTLETKMPGVFAGGDVVTGPASVIEAIGAGKRAAVSIIRYLNGQDLKTGREEVEETTWVKNWERVTKKPRRFPVSLEKPRANFEEVDQLLARIKEVAMFEARRCLECGPCAECLKSEGMCEVDEVIVDETLCSGCNVCAVVCPFGAIKKNEEGVAQVDEYLCKGCGLCAAYCPERAISMQKPTNTHTIVYASTDIGGSSHEL